MKRNITVLLAAFGIGMMLAGCTAKETEEEEPISQKISVEDVSSANSGTEETETGESAADESKPEKISANTSEEENKASTNTSADTEAANTEKDSAGNTEDSTTLYKKFLNNETSAAIRNDYPTSEYMVPMFEKGSSYSLAELGELVSGYYLDPEYTDKTSYDYIQYAYVDCPDSTDETEKNLLVKFVGLNLYSPDDDSYAVYVVTEDNGQLYITDEYQCWARSGATAYGCGILSLFGSGGAGDHYGGLSAILSNGRISTIYGAEILGGWWTSYVNAGIYSDIFDENTSTSLTVAIYNIGDTQYYLYDMSECTEEDKALCETYINRCQEEQGVRWVTEDEIDAMILNQCHAMGIDDAIIQQPDEVVWSNL